MFGKRTFGKLGNRSAARLEIAIGGGLATTSHSLSGQLENISCSGCCFDTGVSAQDSALRVGVDVLVKVERIETFGHLAWVENGRCGVIFTEALPPEKLERLRWIVEHPDQHQQNTANSAGSMWR